MMEDTITKDKVRRSCDQVAIHPTQQVGSFVHVANQVVSCRRQLLKERVRVAIKGQVFDAAFGWSAGGEKTGAQETRNGIQFKFVLKMCSWTDC